MSFDDFDPFPAANQHEPARNKITVESPRTGMPLAAPATAPVSSPYANPLHSSPPLSPLPIFVLSNDLPNSNEQVEDDEDDDDEALNQNETKSFSSVHGHRRKGSLLDTISSAFNRSVSVPTNKNNSNVSSEDQTIYSQPDFNRNNTYSHDSNHSNVNETIPSQLVTLNDHDESFKVLVEKKVTKMGFPKNIITWRFIHLGTQFVLVFYHSVVSGKRVVTINNGRVPPWLIKLKSNNSGNPTMDILVGLPNNPTQTFNATIILNNNSTGLYDLLIEGEPFASLRLKYTLNKINTQNLLMNNSYPLPPQSPLSANTGRTPYNSFASPGIIPTPYTHQVNNLPISSPLNPPVPNPVPSGSTGSTPRIRPSLTESHRLVVNTSNQNNNAANNNQNPTISVEDEFESFALSRSSPRSNLSNGSTPGITPVPISPRSPEVNPFAGSAPHLLRPTSMPVTSSQYMIHPQTNNATIVSSVHTSPHDNINLSESSTKKTNNHARHGSLLGNISEFRSSDDDPSKDENNGDEEINQIQSRNPPFIITTLPTGPFINHQSLATSTYRNRSMSDMNGVPPPVRSISSVSGSQSPGLSPVIPLPTTSNHHTIHHETRKTKMGFIKHIVTWNFLVKDTPHQLSLSHSIVSGKKSLTIDGFPIPKDRVFSKSNKPKGSFINRLSISGNYSNNADILHVDIEYAGGSQFNFEVDVSVQDSTSSSLVYDLSVNGKSFRQLQATELFQNGAGNVRMNP